MLKTQKTAHRHRTRGPSKSIRLDHERLREIRLEQNFTQVGLADAADIDVTSLRRAERGDMMSPSVAEKIAIALDVALEEIQLSDSATGKIPREYNTITTVSPELSLILIEPQSSSIEYVSKRDIHEDVKFTLDEIAARHGIPSLADIRSDGNTIEKRSTYRQWYEEAAKYLVDQHHYQTEVTRGFFVTLKVDNQGTAPAIHIDIHVRFPRILSSASYPSPLGYRAPIIPIDHRVSDAHECISAPNWYNVTTLKRQVWRESSDLSFLENPYENQELYRNLRAHIEKLPIRECRRLEPLYFNIGDSSATELEIDFRIVADNRPNPVEGSLRIELTEIGTAK